ncbi:chemotaxis protein [Malaciobacter mytili LMG 24559]|uniref:Chemotaxis protein n=1 Tax=Malaciobacter mytili LMG 24559 TaxID=1032238 RepID=A0AAX2AJ90_9BACT|nr:PAS domain-containing protein [Malaciobacter mytili]AXH14049.1 PAS sensor-containing signal transduction protein [Malaciobacter mytili LMG 24559]RXK16928.1 chemotaxis protein [Malaciobacter mytili LMG 24559]
MQYNESEFLIETIVPKDELIVSRTDLKGNITYANETFAQISGYEVEELIGKPHNIVRHPDMPKKIFKELWKTLQEGKSWSGFIKNLRKDRGYYWVYAQISAVKKDGKLVEYKSIRTPISFEDKIKYQRLYDKIKKQDNESIRVVSYI